jgi:hypothetical protein
MSRSRTWRCQSSGFLMVMRSVIGVSVQGGGD